MDSEHPLYRAFLEAWHQRDETRMAALVDAMAHDPAPDVAQLAEMRATMASKRGDYAQAIDILSPVIAAGGKRRTVCLMQRQRAFAALGRWREALADIDAVLADTTPHVVERFRQLYLYERAYVLAKLGDPRFEETAAKVDPSYTPWREGGMKSAQDFQPIADAARKARGGGSTAAD